MTSTPPGRTMVVWTPKPAASGSPRNSIPLARRSATVAWMSSHMNDSWCSVPSPGWTPSSAGGRAKISQPPPASTELKPNVSPSTPRSASASGLNRMTWAPVMAMESMYEGGRGVAERGTTSPLSVFGPDQPLAHAVVVAIRAGDLEALGRLLREHPELATGWVGPAVVGPDDRTGARSLLHVAADWPGHYPNGAATVALLVVAGADVNARFTGGHSETPLHWAASSDDVDVLDALLDAGADIEAPGAVIAGGTPVSDAVAFAQWRAARRLIERGARTRLPEAAALGLIDRVEAAWASSEGPSPDEVTAAFWYACHGGSQAAAEYLLERGAEINWVSSWDELTPLDAARRSEHDDLVAWLRQRGGKSVAELRPTA